jgi:hypothetical protein
VDPAFDNYQPPVNADEYGLLFGMGGCFDLEQCRPLFSTEGR